MTEVHTGVCMLLALSTHGCFSSDHYVEQCVLCFRTSSFSCAFTFEAATVSNEPFSGTIHTLFAHF